MSSGLIPCYQIDSEHDLVFNPLQVLLWWEWSLAPSEWESTLTTWPHLWRPALGISLVLPCWPASVSGSTPSKVKRDTHIGVRGHVIPPVGHIWYSGTNTAIKIRNLGEFKGHMKAFLLTDLYPYVLYPVDLLFLCLIPLWVVVSSKHPASHVLLRTGWEPMITAMAISRYSSPPSLTFWKACTL